MSAGVRGPAGLTWTHGRCRQVTVNHGSLEGLGCGLSPVSRARVRGRGQAPCRDVPVSQVLLPSPVPKDEGEALASWRVRVGLASGSCGHANGRVFCIVTAHSVLGQKEGGIAFVIPRCGVFVARI